MSTVERQQVPELSWEEASESASGDQTRVSEDTLPWVEVARGSPYFATDAGEPWTPIGQNDAVSWVELNGLFRNRNRAAVVRHLAALRASGVTCLRLMLEYAQVRYRYLERPVGTLVASMVRLWDDLFMLCEQFGLRILLTPFDTFWMWRHWRYHPYNQANGGPLDTPARLLLCPQVRALIKARLAFAVERWGGSGALFAWDLWNEIHPAQAQDSEGPFMEFIADLSQHVRGLERRLYGRSHPQTVSLFGPELVWRPHMALADPIFRHPDLDFASLHVYQESTIDDPRNTIDPAVGMGEIVRGSLTEIRDQRPFLDTEHGPIHTFKDHHKTLPAQFDDEYFRHMQWAHVASGAAGGGMRWPNRKPHVLTRGMRRAQRALAQFLPLIDWTTFRRRNLNAEIACDRPDVVVFGCGDGAQALVWLVRRDTIGSTGRLSRAASPVQATIAIPGLGSRRYSVTAWDTTEGRVTASFFADAKDGRLAVPVPGFVADVALAVRRG